jgi:hypothetical protein
MGDGPCQILNLRRGTILSTAIEHDPEDAKRRAIGKADLTLEISKTPESRLKELWNACGIGAEYRQLQEEIDQHP